MKLITAGIALVAIMVIAVVGMRSRKKLELRVAPEQPPIALPAPAQQETPAPQQLAASQSARQIESLRAKEQERQKELEAAGAALQKLIEGAVSMSQNNSELCAGVLRGWLNDKAKVELAE